MEWRWRFFVLLCLLSATSSSVEKRDSNSIYGQQHLRLTNNPMEFGWNQKDNRKPAFKNCLGYAPVVKEEQDKGTFVIQVEADDPDEGNNITYDLITSASERAKFEVNSKTGQIYTNHIFDRDEPSLEKSVYVTVKATDDGVPPLDDVCTFKVTIEDINDNPPYFIKAKYDERMAEDTKEGEAVMRISASDLDDGDNSIIEYEILPMRDYQYFRIEKSAGIIYLAKPIDKSQNGLYTINVRAYNVHGREQQATTEVKIRVISSNKKPPSFINISSIQDPIYLKENFIDYSTPIAVLKAVSNVEHKPEVIFELITGRTEETNTKKTFVYNQTGNEVQILLGKSLDYESITSYTLTMTVRNVHDLVAEHIVRVKILDVNDNIPYFTEVTVGYISENEAPGTPVMQVRAFDMDGTEANNIVTFELADNKEFFAINPQTGNITALTTFDREERDFYNVKVIARDNSPSALLGSGEPNAGTQVFRIEIVDKNDHKPKFSSEEYHAGIKEDANINFIVVEVQAEDIDAASQIFYSIVNGNVGEAFKIEPKTGKISVNNHLDYETITEYTLQIRAFDGIYDDNTTVIIKVENVNDNPPKFKQENYTTTIQEETVIQDCIIKIEAVDPDIKDPNSPQHIKYFVVKEEQKELLTIDDEGCLRLIQPLDRDPPNGHKNWQVIIAAIDEDGDGEKRLTDVAITLTDINDNAPEITNNQPVIWGENRNPGQIVQLQANDFDEQQNGPPFTYEIAANASEDIKEKFSIQRDYLYANVMFDREEQKEYFIPILISDSGEPKQSKVNTLHLIIGDENDNPMKEGRSRIFVYNYNGEAPSTKIGRVFVDDADDWDLNDKTFTWKDQSNEINPHEYFALDQNNGEITMLERTPAGEYKLLFSVEESSAHISTHSVDAEVTVIVKEIPEEAVDKSGSIRFYNLTEEQFIGISRDSNLDTTLSLKDQLQKLLAKFYNTSLENVDVFTVLAYNTSEKPQTLDVRFSAHGSPYYSPEKLNGILSTSNHQQEIEHALGLEIQMINIDECLIEKKKCETSCTNVLYKSHVPHMIYSNTTSFVGVNAYVKAECECKASLPQIECLNNGTYDAVKGQCECDVGFNGPYCERVSVGFHGNGFAMYPPISPCDNTKISLELAPRIDNGLVMYIGPMSYNHLLPIQDFLSLELVEGFPVLTVDYGTGATRIEHKHVRLESGKSYTIEITLQRTGIEMLVDNCKLSKCMSVGAPQGPNEFLNVNSPVQLGGTPINLEKIGRLFNWTFTPSTHGYSGCISNLTISGHTYNIGEPHFYKNIDPGCQNAVVAAVQFGINRNFLIAIIACICILLILLLAVVVQKRQQNGWNEKDTDDIRETIINYEDEGGGERDTDYDLNVLRPPPIYEEKPNHGLMIPPNLHNNNIQDIVGFLGDKKDSCDKDNLAYPVDDVRHYAYEGDGNSDGSLSSLASCTDEGDLNFDYLSNFGPRFRKLADMYGEEPSDDDSNVDDEPGWRI